MFHESAAPSFITGAAWDSSDFHDGIGAGLLVEDGRADAVVGPMSHRKRGGRLLRCVAVNGDHMSSHAAPRELRDLIEAHIKGFNEQDNDLFLSVFGDTAIIIDGIAPYRWLNPKGPANWLADVEKWRASLGVTYEHLAYEMGFWNVEGSSGYAVVSGTLTVKTKDQTMVRTGTLAYTFAKHDGVWKIGAQAWGRTS